MDAGKLITVEVAYALPDRQAIVELRVEEGTTALDAARLSGLTERFEGIDLEKITVSLTINGAAITLMAMYFALAEKRGFDLAKLVREIVGYPGRIVQDASKPDGTPRKLLEVRRLSALGWTPKIGLREGIEATYRWFLAGWAKRLSWQGVAVAFGTTWENVYRSVRHAVLWGLVHRDLDGIEAITPEPQGDVTLEEIRAAQDRDVDELSNAGALGDFQEVLVALVVDILEGQLPLLLRDAHGRGAGCDPASAGRGLGGAVQRLVQVACGRRPPRRPRATPSNPCPDWPAWPQDPRPAAGRAARRAASLPAWALAVQPPLPAPHRHPCPPPARRAADAGSMDDQPVEPPRQRRTHRRPGPRVPPP